MHIRYVFVCLSVDRLEPARAIDSESDTDSAGGVIAVSAESHRYFLELTNRKESPRALVRRRAMVKQESGLVGVGAVLAP